MSHEFPSRAVCDTSWPWAHNPEANVRRAARRDKPVSVTCKTTPAARARCTAAPWGPLPAGDRALFMIEACDGGCLIGVRVLLASLAGDALLIVVSISTTLRVW